MARSFAGKQFVKVRATARSSHAVQIRYDHLLHEQRGNIAQTSSICRRVTLTPKVINRFRLLRLSGRIKLIRVEIFGPSVFFSGQ